MEKSLLFDEAVTVVKTDGRVSIPQLQRRLKIGYSHASNLIEELEEHGIVGPQNGVKPRNVLV